MKYLVLLLLLVACDKGVDKHSYDEAVDSVRETKLKLQSCQASLDVYRGGSLAASSPDTTEPEQQPEESSYQDVSYYSIEVGNHTVKCDTRDDGNNESPSCGSTFSDCENGYTYRCMQNVKYKTGTEKREIK